MSKGPAKNIRLTLSEDLTRRIDSMSEAAGFQVRPLIEAHVNRELNDGDTLVDIVLETERNRLANLQQALKKSAD